jgi:sugar (pentulose or hexulose) kinase
MTALYIGIDLGTSGCRACAIDDNANAVHMTWQSLPAAQCNNHRVEQDANIWWRAVQYLLDDLGKHIDTTQVQAIAIDGTSGTLLVTDAQGTPLGKALMYNDASCWQQAEAIKRVAPENSAAQGATSALAKLLYLQQAFPQAQHACHQADWIAGKLSDHVNISDANNALKTGYDPITQCWPEWLNRLNINRALLPKVFAPGSITGTVSKAISKKFNFNPKVKIIAGTTDSVAAFIATGVEQVGTAVTSLGSTLVLKIISAQPINSARHGVYSHKLGDVWLAGGASNTGGAVLKQFFSDAQLNAMTPLLKPAQATQLDFYPLCKAGERFPVNDRQKKPRLSPRPENDVDFFQGMLESIGRIEQQGYKKLHQLGAPYPQRIISAGGGSKNSAWTKIRRHILGVPVCTAQHSAACYGSALLAKRAFNK